MSAAAILESHGFERYQPGSSPGALIGPGICVVCREGDALRFDLVSAFRASNCGAAAARASAVLGSDHHASGSTFVLVAPVTSFTERERIMDLLGPHLQAQTPRADRRVVRIDRRDRTEARRVA